MINVSRDDDDEGSSWRIIQTKKRDGPRAREFRRVETLQSGSGPLSLSIPEEYYHQLMVNIVSVFDDVAPTR